MKVRQVQLAVFLPIEITLTESKEYTDMHTLLDWAVDRLAPNDSLYIFAQNLRKLLRTAHEEHHGEEFRRG